MGYEGQIAGLGDAPPGHPVRAQLIRLIQARLESTARDTSVTEPAGTEGAGEVQTPVHGAAADTLAPGDRVWMRHAKAGELAERFRSYHVLGEDGQVTAVPTYRGEGQCLG
jgi:D-serine deaminase-like pyridoxal phosphate-dependent protein